MRKKSYRGKVLSTVRSTDTARWFRWFVSLQRKLMTWKRRFRVEVAVFFLLLFCSIGQMVEVEYCVSAFVIIPLYGTRFFFSNASVDWDVCVCLFHLVTHQLWMDWFTTCTFLFVESYRGGGHAWNLCACLLFIDFLLWDIIDYDVQNWNKNMIHDW